MRQGCYSEHHRKGDNCFSLEASPAADKRRGEERQAEAGSPPRSGQETTWGRKAQARLEAAWEAPGQAATHGAGHLRLLSPGPAQQPGPAETAKPWASTLADNSHCQRGRPPPRPQAVSSAHCELAPSPWSPQRHQGATAPQSLKRPRSITRNTSGSCVATKPNNSLVVRFRVL